MRCLICNNKKHHEFCVKDNQKYIQCLLCKHVFIENKINEKKLLHHYSNRQSHHASSVKEKWDYSETKFSLIYRPLLNTISKYTNRKERLLDVGCSNGSFVAAAQRESWDSCGVEIEKRSSEIAKKHNIKVHNKELHKISFPVNYFTAITMWNFIEHIFDPNKLFVEVSRIMKRGGILALSTPNINSIGWLLLKEQWRAVEPAVHLNLFNTFGLEKLISSHGFQLICIKTIDIKPSTCKDFINKISNRDLFLSSNSIASQGNTMSNVHIKFIIALRNMLNIPINMSGFGEDIYAYFKKI